jgi:hypothetical protein
VVVTKWDGRIHGWNCNHSVLRSTFTCKRWTMKLKQILYELRAIVFKKTGAMLSYYFGVILLSYFFIWPNLSCWSQWPRGLRSAASRLLGLWVRIPPGSMDVCCDFCVLSGRDLCVEPITHPEETYRMWCVVVCDLETSSMRRPYPTRGLLRQRQTNSLSCSVIFWNLYWNSDIYYVFGTLKSTPWSQLV